MVCFPAIIVITMIAKNELAIGSDRCGINWIINKHQQRRECAWPGRTCIQIRRLHEENAIMGVVKAICPAEYKSVLPLQRNLDKLAHGLNTSLPIVYKRLSTGEHRTINDREFLPVYINQILSRFYLCSRPTACLGIKGVMTP